MLINADAGDNQVIKLRFRPTIDVYLGYIISLIVLVLSILLVVRYSKKSPKKDKKGEDKADKKEAPPKEKPQEKKPPESKTIESFSSLQKKSVSDQIEAYRKEGEEE